MYPKQYGILPYYWLPKWVGNATDPSARTLQIYNEIITDLLKVGRTSLSIREDKKKGVFVEGLSEWAVRSPNEVYALM